MSCKLEKKSPAKDFNDKILELVLSEKNIGQSYVIRTMYQNNQIEYNIKYLGYIINKRDSIRFLNYTVITGIDSKHSNGAIILYNNENIRIGMYQVGSSSSLPDTIVGANLIFDYKDEDCNLNTKISFTDSIPRKIFINCNNEGGDIYTFTK